MEQDKNMVEDIMQESEYINCPHDKAMGKLSSVRLREYCWGCEFYNQIDLKCGYDEEDP